MCVWVTVIVGACENGKSEGACGRVRVTQAG